MPNVISLNPALLRPNNWNSNVVSPENERKLDEAIKRFGFFKPIIVREIDEGYEIIGGEHRAQSAVRLGLKEVPVMNLGFISDHEAKEISLADNARYGADDTLQLAELLKDLGNSDELKDFLPYTSSELDSVFAAVDIALDDLDLDEKDEKDAEPELVQAKQPKTHTIMRFKVSLDDAERLTALISKTQKRQGFTISDDLTNAGDALVHLLLGLSEDNETDDE